MPKLTCKHCGQQIELANSVFVLAGKYRHTKDKMFACFDKNGHPMRDGNRYLTAEPKDKNH